MHHHLDWYALGSLLLPVPTPDVASPLTAVIRVCALDPNCTRFATVILEHDVAIYLLPRGIGLSRD
jgi:hypothetical protein